MHSSHHFLFVLSIIDIIIQSTESVERVWEGWIKSPQGLKVSFRWGRKHFIIEEEHVTDICYGIHLYDRIVLAFSEIAFALIPSFICYLYFQLIFLYRAPKASSGSGKGKGKSPDGQTAGSPAPTAKKKGVKKGAGKKGGS